MVSAERPFTIFVSSVSREFHSWRETTRNGLQATGARVIYQIDNPAVLGDTAHLYEEILKADLIVCLIGLEAGQLIEPRLMRELCASGRVPPDAPQAMTWTQWEYHCARQARSKALAEGRDCWLMTVFCNMADPAADSKWTESAATDQRPHIRRIVEESRHSISPLWSAGICDADALMDLFFVAADYEGGNLFDAFQASRWRMVRSLYRHSVVQAWANQYGPDLSEGERTARAPAPERGFIADQGMQRLEQPCEKLRIALSPAAFVAGRDTELELSAHDSGTWTALVRDELVALLRGRLSDNAAYRPPMGPRGAWAPRVCIVSAGGVGKTSCTRRIVLDLCRAEPAVLAVRVSALALEQSAIDMPEILAREIVRALGEAQAAATAMFDPRKGGSAARTTPTERLIDFVRHRLTVEIRDGAVVVLVDELDHIPDPNLALLVKMQLEEEWSRCPVVVATRPHALKHWEEGTSGEVAKLVLQRWCFIELREFSEAQSRRLLGSVAELGREVARYDLLVGNLRGLIRVPRVLAYITGSAFSLAQLRAMRTAADVFWAAINAILAPSIERITHHDGTPATRPLQWHLLAVLAAIAYLSRVEVDEPATNNRGQHDIDWDRLAHLMRQTIERQGQNGMLVDYDVAVHLAEDRRMLARLAAVIDNGILESMPMHGAARMLGSPVKWDNVTVRDFLAAFWLAQWSVEASGPLGCRLPEALVYLPDQEPQRDAAYDLNRFLADMPSEAIHPESWIGAVRSWYEPGIMPFASRRRPGEMLFHSWGKVHAIARLEVDDWWDVPYEVVAGRSPAKRIEGIRTLAWEHPNRQTQEARPAARAAARECLASYRGEFAALLSGAPGPVQARLRRFVEDDWRRVEGNASFRMGSPRSRQGMPRKTQAYWRSMLNRAEIGGPQVAAELGEECTPKRWFVGVSGVRDRRGDVAEMTGFFKDYAERIRRCPDEVSWERDEAIDRITSIWNTPAETPEEAEQSVAPISLHALPVQLDLFAIFAGGHPAIVRRDLELYGADPAYPGERPAIFISWYDAWAFCQWATWIGTDGIRQACRLPHEPEWELACRQAPDGGEVPFGQRYWWGETFYEKEDDPVIERLSRPEAHADGYSGCTRDPRVAKPNGAGLKDMLGNVWEWCANHYDPRWLEGEVRQGLAGAAYSRHRPASRPPDYALRALRGGLWYYVDHLSTCANRYRQLPDDADYKKGFRVMREPDDR